MSDLKKLTSHIGTYRTDLFLAVFFVVAETVIELFIPFVMAGLIDVGVAGKNVPYIINRGIVMLVFAALSFVSGMLYAVYIARTAYGFGAALREEEYAAVQKYSFADLDSFGTSSLITRMTTDTTILQNAIINGVRPIVRGPVMMILGIVLAFLMNAGLAGIFFVLLPILTFVTFTIIRITAPMYEVMQRIMDSVNRIVQENLTAVRAVRVFVRGESESEKFAEVNRDLAQTTGRTYELSSLNRPVFQIILYTAIVLIMWLGGNMIMRGTLKVGELTGVLSYALQILNSVMMVSAAFLLLNRSAASAKRVIRVLDRQPEIAEPAEPRGEVPDGRVDFDGVSFKYGKNAREYSLSDVTLHIASGETIGILGGTGSSKTTLVQMIPRLYDADEGTVRVGGADVRAYGFDALNRAVGIVLQNNILFSGTIRENLLWGNPAATEAEIAEALRISCADEFVDRLPHGLETELGQGGVNVSGGQKQRLCIARTLLKKPKILILDDSVSAVDSVTNRKIREGLFALQGMTKIIIAQRVANVMETDRIVILDNGSVHAVGSHETLLREDPIYREIWSTQTGGTVHG